jgi:mono/diheme cytochrome c family protein
VGLAAAGLLNASSTAHAARPTIYVLPAETILSLPQPTALGLYVPGAGGTVSRENAIASLRRGKVENALLGGKPGGKILADVRFEIPPFAARPIVYLALPPPGVHPNTKRYPVAIVGAGWEGILTSEATRIRGLVPIADIARTLVAVQEGRDPPIGSEADDDPVSDLRALDRRLARTHRDRGWTLAAVVLAVLALVALRPRAAVVGGSAAIVGSMLFSWAGATRLSTLVAGLVAFTLVGGLASTGRRRFIPAAVALSFAVYLAVLTLAPETNSLAVLGARPDGGGRFYGMTNQVETLLLAPFIAAAAVASLRWLVPLGVLALVTVGWSEAGADGGGLLVFGAAFAVMAFRLRGVALTPRRAVLAGVAVVVLGLAFVGLDAALGGSSHISDAVGTGPGSLLGDLGRRLHLSWASATKDVHNVVLFVGCLAALAWIASRRPRPATVEAMLVALGVSLLVNDTPVDAIGLGALGCAALLRWESVDSRPMRRGVLTASCLLAVLALAGCGDEGTIAPTAREVVGTVEQEAPGKAIFINTGCGACHTFKPAGPDANGKIGPDLDKLPDYAKTAKQPLATFVHDSIIDPGKYIQKGFQNVMPKSYNTLPPADLQALVDFLSKQQG